LLTGLWVTSPAADDATDCQSTDPQTRIQGCTNLLKKRKLSGADQATVYVYRGIGHARIGNHAKAIEDYGQSIKLFPKRADPYYLRGVSHAAVGDAAAAIRDLGSAIERNPKHADALTHRGRAFSGVGEFDLAIADFSSAIAISGSPDAYAGRARAFIEKRDFARAVSDLDIVIASFPNNPELLYQRGIANAALSNLDAALADFGGVLASYPDSTDVLDARGQVFAQAGDIDKALADFDAVISIDPGRFDTLNRRARIHMQSGKPDKAIADFDAAIAAKPDYADALYGRALAYMSIGDQRRAIDDLNATLAMVPDHPGLLYHRGIAHADEGNLDAALTDYNRVVEIQPDHPEVHYYRGLAHTRKGMTSEAISDFDRMLQINPDHEGARHHRDLAHRAQTETPSASVAKAPSGKDPGDDEIAHASCPIDLSDPTWDRVTVARLFPPAGSDWAPDEVQITEIELTTPEMEEFSRFLGALSGLGTGKFETQELPTPIRVQATRTYRSSDKSLKVVIDTVNTEMASLVAAIFENEEVRKASAERGIAIEKIRGHEVIFNSEPPGAVVRVDDFGLVSFECSFAECRADIRALINSFEFGCVGQFVAYDHRKQATAEAE